MTFNRITLSLAVFALLQLFDVATLACAESSPKKPNILLIVADDLGYSDLGCYGSEISTPNLDKLAAGGARFKQFYNSSRCCPSRASLLTGLHPHKAGVGLMGTDHGARFPGYRGFLTSNSLTIAEALKPAGYRTYMVGKWHLGNRYTPVQRGFDEYYGMLRGFTTFFEEKPAYGRLPAGRPTRTYEPGKFYATDVFGDYAIDFIRDGAISDAPWFMYLAFSAPHFPLHALPKAIARYTQLYEQGWDKIREQRLDRQKRLGLVDKDTTLPARSHIPPNWVADPHGWGGKQNPAWDELDEPRRHDLARRMAIYAAMVDNMDQNIGRVLDHLRAANEFDNTLIVFFSDNGACAEWDPFGFDKASGPDNLLNTGDDLSKMGGPESYISYGSAWANASNTPLRLYKHYMHEGGIASPLIVHWPAQLKANKSWRETPGHIVDVMPTLLQAAGAQYPAKRGEFDLPPMEGISLLPAARGEDVKRGFLAWEHEGSRAIREGNWKLVCLPEAKWELYDLKSDWFEENDLAVQHPERVKQMAQQWQQWADENYVLPAPPSRKPDVVK